MRRYLAGILLIAAAAVYTLPFIGCSSTTETKYDTTYVAVHDSVRVALVRFVSLMPDNSAINIKLSKNSNYVYATTFSQTTSSYVPFIPDSSRWLFLFNGNTYLDSISVAGTQLRKGSINTFGLFDVQDHILFAGGGNNDSIKQTPIPNGYAMVRFINGNNWASGSQQTVDLDTESVQNTILTSVFAQPPGNYIRIPAGNHKLIVSIHGTQTAVDGLQPRNGIFEAGLYYTVRFIGDSQNPPLLSIDPE